MIVSGVAKAYAMTGWRIGYAACAPELARVMSKIQSQSTSNACSISHAATVEALTVPQDFVEMARAEFRARRDLVFAGLASMDSLRFTLPDGAFYAFPTIHGPIGRRTPDGAVIVDDTAFAGHLLSAGHIACVQGAVFGLSPAIRLSYAASRAELTEALDRLAAAVAALN